MSIYASQLKNRNIYIELKIQSADIMYDIKLEYVRQKYYIYNRDVE